MRLHKRENHSQALPELSIALTVLNKWVGGLQMGLRTVHMSRIGRLSEPFLCMANALSRLDSQMVLLHFSVPFHLTP